MYQNIVKNIITILISILVVTIVLFILNSSPLDIYKALFNGAFGNIDKLSRTMLITSIMALTGLALVITFSTGLWNIGIEGQVLFGAIGATFIARSFMGDLTRAPFITVLSGAAFGGFLGFLSAILKTKFNVHEIFGGLGLDFLAAGLIVYLVIGPWKREGIASTGGTDLFPEASWMPHIGNSNFPIFPLLIMFIVFILLAFLLTKTSLGLKLIATGSNKNATDKFKINSIHYIAYAFIIAGAVGGMAGSIQATGIYHKLVPNISGGYGFLGILIALIAGRNLYSVLLISFVFASIMVGGVQLQLRLGMDSSFPYIIESVFVISWLITRASDIDSKITKYIFLKDK